MKIERSKEWWMSKIDTEGDESVGAGALHKFRPTAESVPGLAAQERARVVEKVSAWASRVTEAIDNDRDLDSNDELMSAMDVALALGRFLKRGGQL